jgi:hypothetical protein
MEGKGNLCLIHTALKMETGTLPATSLSVYKDTWCRHLENCKICCCFCFRGKLIKNCDRYQTKRCEVEYKNAPLSHLYLWHQFEKRLRKKTSKMSIATHLLAYQLTFSHVQDVSAAKCAQRGSIKMVGENYLYMEKKILKRTNLILLHFVQFPM